MVQDKANGTIRDLRISPVKSATLSLSYYTATCFQHLLFALLQRVSVLLMWLLSVGICHSQIYSFCFLIFYYLFCLEQHYLRLSIFSYQHKDKFSAVGTIISAGYGFICGAYMPISSFGKGLQKIISFLPGTYGTSLIRNHTMQGALAEIQIKVFQ